MAYQSVLWTPQTVVCAENLQQMSDNIDIAYQQAVDNGKGIVGQKEITTTNKKTGSSWDTVGTLRNVTTESGRLYRYSCYLPKVENPGDRDNNVLTGDGSSVQFQLRQNTGGDNMVTHLTTYVWPGPTLRWTHFYGEVFITPGEVTNNYSVKFAPLFGRGVATIACDNDQLKGYITIEDVGKA